MFNFCEVPTLAPQCWYLVIRYHGGTIVKCTEHVCPTKNNVLLPGGLTFKLA